MAHREEHFLDLARRIVFSNPQHPYHEMFRIAGCTGEDLAAEVGSHGLEATLEKLAAAGVYLTHDEFKGKTPLVRGGREIPCGPQALLNPLVRGRMVSIQQREPQPRNHDPEKHASSRLTGTAYHRLQWREFELAGRASVQVRPILPSSIGIGDNLRCIRPGEKPAKWFAQSGHWRDEGHYRTVTHCIVRSARLMGAPLPLPDYLPENDFSPVARWIARAKAGRASVRDAQLRQPRRARGRRRAGRRAGHCGNAFSGWRRSADRRETGGHRSGRVRGLSQVRHLRGGIDRERVPPHAHRQQRARASRRGGRYQPPAACATLRRGSELADVHQSAAVRRAVSDQRRDGRRGHSGTG